MYLAVLFLPALWGADDPAPLGADDPAPLGADGAEQTLIVRVAVPGERPIEAIVATLTRDGGETIEVPLYDALGEQAGAPYDGIWSAAEAGPPARYAQVRLEVTATGATPVVAFEGVVRTEDLPTSLLGFRLTSPPEAIVARRAVYAYPGHAAEAMAARPVWAAFGWLWAAVFWVGAMVARTEAARRAGG